MYAALKIRSFIPLDRLCLSPQCGFASCEIGNKLTELEQWNKLKLSRKSPRPCGVNKKYDRQIFGNRELPVFNINLSSKPRPTDGAWYAAEYCGVDSQ